MVQRSPVQLLRDIIRHSPYDTDDDYSTPESVAEWSAIWHGEGLHHFSDVVPFVVNCCREWKHDKRGIKQAIEDRWATGWFNFERELQLGLAFASAERDHQYLLRDAPLTLVAVMVTKHMPLVCQDLYLTKRGGKPRVFAYHEMPAWSQNVHVPIHEWVTTRPPLYGWCNCHLGKVHPGHRDDEHDTHVTRLPSFRRQPIQDYLDSVRRNP